MQCPERWSTAASDAATRQVDCNGYCINDLVITFLVSLPSHVDRQRARLEFAFAERIVSFSDSLQVYARIIR